MCFFPIDLPDEKPLWKVPASYTKGYNEGFSAGRALGVKECVEKLRACSRCEYKTYTICRDVLKAIAALEGVKEE